MTLQDANLGLTVIVAGLLLGATLTDLKARVIPNQIPFAIVALAPLFWIANGTAFWPGSALMIGQSLACLVVFGAFFSRGLMGGGDVKLIAALALWFPGIALLNFLVLMSVLGGLLTLAQLLIAKLRKSEDPIEVPYGVAIAAAALWALFDTQHLVERYFNG